MSEGRVVVAEVLAERALGRDPEPQRRAQEGAQALELRRRAQWRLVLLSCAFSLCFAGVAAKMVWLAGSEPAEPRLTGATVAPANRAALTDRKGRILATNVAAWSVYAHPKEMIDPAEAAERLAAVFPDLDHDRLLRSFTDGRSFVWVKRPVSPDQRQRAHDLGLPGVYFGRREARIYPAGAAAAHILGGSRSDKEDVHSAQTVGMAGAELYFDEMLRDPGRNGAPLSLSIDLAAQMAMREVLSDAVRLYRAKGAAGVVMDVNTGEVLSLVSLPDFDPNFRPRSSLTGEQAESPLFNRAAQGVYELGSAFKPFTAALALERGVAGVDTLIDTRGPLTYGRFRIRDFHRMPRQMTLSDIIVESSNVGTARLALMAGIKEHQIFLQQLGLFEPTPLEVAEASRGKPLLPPRWGELSSMTISFGHGISVTPLHLAQGIASIVNGGTLVRPTLLRTDYTPQDGPRVVSEATSRRIREILRKVVTDGTGRNAAVAGYEVGGKTGTADKPKKSGGYHRDRVIASFSAIMPSSDPRYVMVIILDEAVDRSWKKPRRTAGWTAAPTAKKAIERIGPILGLRPAPVAPEGDAPQAVLARN